MHCLYHTFISPANQQTSFGLNWFLVFNEGYFILTKHLNNDKYFKGSSHLLFSASSFLQTPFASPVEYFLRSCLSQRSQDTLLLWLLVAYLWFWHLVHIELPTPGKGEWRFWLNAWSTWFYFEWIKIGRPAPAGSELLSPLDCLSCQHWCKDMVIVSQFCVMRSHSHPCLTQSVPFHNPWPPPCCEHHRQHK